MIMKVTTYKDIKFQRKRKAVPGDIITPLRNGIYRPLLVVSEDAVERYMNIRYLSTIENKDNVVISIDMFGSIIILNHEDYRILKYYKKIQKQFINKNPLAKYLFTGII